MNPALRAQKQVEMIKGNKVNLRKKRGKRNLNIKYQNRLLKLLINENSNKNLKGNTFEKSL